MTLKQVKYIQGFKGINNSESTEVSMDLASNLENLVYDVDKTLLQSANFMTEVDFTYSETPISFDTIFTFTSLSLTYEYNSSKKYIIYVGAKDSTVYYQLYKIKCVMNWSYF